MAFVELQSQHFSASKCAFGHNDYVWQEGGFSGIDSVRC